MVLKVLYYLCKQKKGAKPQMNNINIRKDLRKDYQVGVRLREQEFRDIQKLATQSSLSMSSYCRHILLGVIYQQDKKRQKKRK